MKKKCSIYLCGLLLSLVGARVEAQLGTSNDFPKREIIAGVWRVGTIEPKAIKESSGVIVCGFDPNVFWTHNDGPDRRLFGITRTGKPVAEFIVEGPASEDWEDIARDKQGHLYLADIGNNNLSRTELAVHRFDEPDPKQQKGRVKVNRSWQLRFSGKPFNCESLFIWKGYGYVISKVFNDERAEIYRFSLAEQHEPCVIEFVAKLPVTSPVTGADISADGQRLGFVCKNGACVMRIDGDVNRAATAPLFRVKFREGQIEGCCFVPEGLLATAETREIYLFTNEMFRARTD